MTKVLGLDPSLTSTGLAGRGWTTTIKPANRSRAHRDRNNRTNDARLRIAYNHQRITTITSQLNDYLTGVDLVVMEGLAFDAHDTDRQLAGLSWIIRDRLFRRAIPYAVVAPSTLKQFVTGNGAAGKDLMWDTISRTIDWFDGDTDDEADAAGLLAMGYAHLGSPFEPLTDCQAAAMAKVIWPELPTAPPTAVPFGDDRSLPVPVATVTLPGVA